MGFREIVKGNVTSSLHVFHLDQFSILSVALAVWRVLAHTRAFVFQND